jgi:hypothetical protein
MTWNYDPTMATPKDQVRWLVADTDAQDPLEQDEEILFVLAGQPNVTRAAATVARQIARQFARQCDLDIAREVRVNLSDRSKNYFQLAKDLTDEANKGAAGGGVGVFAGGIAVSQKQAAEQDADRVTPAFSRRSQGTRAVPTWTPERGEEGEP